MFFDINTQNGVPVYEQVFRQIVFAIASGAIESGELVPSVRKMARELAINPNTVAKAYRQLQSEGYVDPIPGSGLAVANKAKTKSKSLRARVFKTQIESFVEDAKRGQFTADEIKKLFNEAIQKKY